MPVLCRLRPLVSRVLSFIWELTLWQNARVTPHECLAMELHFPEVEPLEKIATRADLVDVRRMPLTSPTQTFLQFPDHPLSVTTCAQPPGQHDRR